MLDNDIKLLLSIHNIPIFLMKRSDNLESKLWYPEFFQKRTKKFVYTTMRLVFVCYLEEIEDTKKAFRN